MSSRGGSVEQLQAQLTVMRRVELEAARSPEKTTRKGLHRIDGTERTIPRCVKPAPATALRECRLRLARDSCALPSPLIARLRAVDDDGRRWLANVPVTCDLLESSRCNLVHDDCLGARCHLGNLWAEPWPNPAFLPDAHAARGMQTW
eukprot:6479250-Prymnesium_polylepis.3